MTPGKQIQMRCTGTAYLLVLLVAAIVTVASLGAIGVARSRLASAALDASAVRCESAAHAAFQLAFARIAADPEWRSASVNGAIVNDTLIGAVTVDVVADDPDDGTLDDDPADTVTLTVSAHEGDARRSFGVNIMPDIAPLDCLQSVIHARGNIVVESLATVQGDATISSNGSILAEGASIFADVVAVGAVSGLTFLGGTAAGSAPKTMPDIEAVFSTYESDAVSIRYSQLDSGVLTECALGPGVNPFGNASPSGRYLIDCGGKSLTIETMRLTGTLVVRNTSKVAVQGSTFMTAVEGTEPVLLVDGPVTISTSSQPLSETGATCNLNPSGAPYRTHTDSDTIDCYPSRIEGLVHATGPIRFDGSAVSFVGIAICEANVSVAAGTHLSLVYSPLPHASPPVAFCLPSSLRVVGGSFRRVLDTE